MKKQYLLLFNIIYYILNSSKYSKRFPVWLMDTSDHGLLHSFRDPRANGFTSSKDALV